MKFRKLTENKANIIITINLILTLILLYFFYAVAMELSVLDSKIDVYDRVNMENSMDDHKRIYGNINDLDERIESLEVQTDYLLRDVPKEELQKELSRVGLPPFQSREERRQKFIKEEILKKNNKLSRKKK